jgi:hypothetical protein
MSTFLFKIYIFIDCPVQSIYEIVNYSKSVEKIRSDEEKYFPPKYFVKNILGQKVTFF